MSDELLGTEKQIPIVTIKSKGIDALRCISMDLLIGFHLKINFDYCDASQKGSKKEYVLLAAMKRNCELKYSFISDEKAMIPHCATNVFFPKFDQREWLISWIGSVWASNEDPIIFFGKCSSPLCVLWKKYKNFSFSDF